MESNNDLEIFRNHLNEVSTMFVDEITSDVETPYDPEKYDITIKVGGKELKIQMCAEAYNGLTDYLTRCEDDECKMELDEL